MRGDGERDRERPGGTGGGRLAESSGGSLLSSVVHQNFDS
jgi:hypothetical protein